MLAIIREPSLPSYYGPVSFLVVYKHIETADKLTSWQGPSKLQLVSDNNEIPCMLVYHVNVVVLGGVARVDGSPPVLLLSGLFVTVALGTMFDKFNGDD